MIWLYGRRSIRGALLVAATQLCVLASFASAQDGDEVIVDPELSGGTKKTPPKDGDEVIVDPELGEPDDGWGGIYTKETVTPGPIVEEEPAYDPLANTGIAMVEIVGQIQADTRHEGGLEDAYETRLRLDSEVEFRRSRRLRLSIGVRTDLFWALPARDDPDLNVPATEGMPGYHQRALDQDRFELDILPLSAYLDVTVADGVHLRLGEQVVTMARMDFYSPIDMLAVHDLRGQPKLEASTPKLAQPAIRLDWDIGAWATLQLFYVPWFMPHLPRSNRDRYVADVLGTSEDSLPTVLDTLVEPSFQTKAPEEMLRFIGPPPDFRTPQVAARLNIRGPGRELAISGGTALEKMPSIYTTPLAEDFAFSRKGWEIPVSEAITRGDGLIDIVYHRYWQFGLDGSFDLGPLTLGFEFTYSPSRHLYYAARPEGEALPQPNVTEPIRDAVRDEQGNLVSPSNVTDPSIRKGVPTVQGALHLEWLRGTRFGLIMEAFWWNALELPFDKDRDWWAYIPGTGAFIGGLVGMVYRIDDGRWTINMAALTCPGPSLILMPQVELRATDELYLNIGASFYEGPAPTRHGGQDLNFGGLYSGYDQVFVGFRYNP
jgi:hypothetical protein